MNGKNRHRFGREAYKSSITPILSTRALSQSCPVIALSAMSPSRFTDVSSGTFYFRWVGWFIDRRRTRDRSDGIFRLLRSGADGDSARAQAGVVDAVPSTARARRTPEGSSKPQISPSFSPSQIRGNMGREGEAN